MSDRLSKVDSVSAMEWYELACLRTGLKQAGNIARPGLLMALGESWAAGAIRASERALGDSLLLVPVAAVMLAAAADSVTRPTTASSFIEGMASVASAAVRRGSRDPAVLRSCVIHSFLVRDRASAWYCGNIAELAGVDPDWHRLRMAWIEVQDGYLGGAAQRIAAIRDPSTTTSNRQAFYQRLQSLVSSETVDSLAVGDMLIGADFKGDEVWGCMLVLGSNGWRPCGLRIPPRAILGDARSHLVWLGDGEKERGMLVPYAFRARDLEWNELDGAYLASIEVRLLVEGEQSVDTTVQLRLRTPTRPSNDMVVTDHFEVAGVTHQAAWSVGFREEGSKRSWSWTSGFVVDSDDAHCNAVMSDLVTGVASQRVSWLRGADTVTLAPMLEMSRTEELSIFFQHVPPPDGLLNLRVALYGRGSDGRERAALTIGVDRRVESLGEGVHLGLDLSQVHAGRYRLAVTATDPATETSCSRSAEVAIR